MSTVASLASVKLVVRRDTPPTARLLIGGESVESQSKEWRDIMNPTMQEMLARVPSATAGEVSAAIRPAHAVFVTWRNTSVGACIHVMLKSQALIREHSPRIVCALATEQGKTPPDAEGDIFHGLEMVEHARPVGSSQQGELLKNVAGAADTCTLHQPIGMCAGITPFDFPIMIPLWMFPVAIVRGSASALKPPEQDLSSTMRLVEPALEAGVSPGVLNVVRDGKDVVNVLCMHERAKAILFVGLTAMGTHVYRLGSERGKHVQSMTGTKNHTVVLPDANRGQATNALIGTAFDAARQHCTATFVIVLVDTAQQWMPDLITKVKTPKMDAGVEPGTDVGPVVSRAAEQRILSPIESDVQQGAMLALDGRDVRIADYEDGSFIGPTISTDVKIDTDIYASEIFGPVLSALTVPVLNDAIVLVSASLFGNGVGLFTQNGVSTHKPQSEIDIGQVGINIPIPVPVPYFSFTDSRGSKLGDPGPYGKQVVQFYTQTKMVTVRWFDGTVGTGGVNIIISLR